MSARKPAADKRDYRRFSELRREIDGDTERRTRANRAYQDGLRDVITHSLTEIRQMRQITQVELAEALDVGQPRISRMERGGDSLLSTVAAYVEALGGHLEVAAVFDDDRVLLELTKTEMSK
ncbi:MAG: helix-turn-helix transcriptional regulator [Acidimicrobiia bacterium]